MLNNMTVAFVAACTDERSDGLTLFTLTFLRFGFHGK